MASFSIANIVVVMIIMALITLAGHRLSGKVTDSQSFFTADGGLPWWAVSASLYATAISAISFISIPASVFREGGNLELAQIEYGAALGKIVMAVMFVRAYYESKSVNTVYDYLSVRISGLIASSVMTLSIVLTVALNSIVVLSAALVLNVLADISVEFSCIGIVGFSILWSWMGGLRTVVWTDTAMFAIFLTGAILSAWITFSSTGLSLTESFASLDKNAKLTLIDLSTDPSNAHTLWTGLLAGTLLGMALITSQSGMQRIRACASVREAKKAFVFSVAFYIVTTLLFAVGLGLTVFYDKFGVPPDLAERLTTHPDQVFPYFIVNEIPDGLSGVFIAALFAAAISTLNSRLAELSDVTVSDIYRRYIRKDAEEKHYLRVARMLIIGWGAVYCVASISLSKINGQNLLELTYLVANSLIGPILAIFFLARFGIGGTRSVVIGSVMSVLASFYLKSINVSTFWWLVSSIIIMIGIGSLASRRAFDRTGVIESVTAQVTIEH